MDKRFQRWEPEADQWLQDGIEQGKPWDEIMRGLPGRSLGSAKTRATFYGWTDLRPAPVKAKNPIIQRLVGRRFEENISLVALAAVVGVNECTLRDAENEKHSPKLCILEAWATALGLDLVLAEAKP